MSQDIHWKNYAGRFRTFPTLIEEDTRADTGMIICIPSFAEPDLISTLQSLVLCTRPNQPVEVIILFNRNNMMTDEETRIHDDSFISLVQWIAEQPDVPFKIYPLRIDVFPDVKGGVGWARKYAMDEAARRLSQSGIIVCLDADCTVADNYLVEIENAFLQHPKLNAASIFFEHAIQETAQDHAASVTQYELHLRYLVHAQRWCGHPFSFYTVGSSMALRRSGYLAQGGMNTRSAGEDFYLLQKFIETDLFFEIKTTTVFPSSRLSQRVPFGTGKAMQQMASGINTNWQTTQFEIFKEIKPLFNSLEALWKSRNVPGSDVTYEGIGIISSLSDNVLSFLQTIHFKESLLEITRHTSGFPSFRKRFFRFFNAFQMIRYMHYMRDHFYPDVNVREATESLFENMGLPPCSTARESLQLLRRLDQQS